MRVLTIAAVALLVGASASAQDETGRKVATEVAMRVPLEKAVKGAPYSADTIVEGLQLLADGNRIVHKSTGHVYRDSEGRTRREEDQPTVSREMPYVSGAGPMVSIVDPIAGYSYSLDPQNKIAWRTPTGTTAGIMEKLQVVEQKRKIDAEQAASGKASAGAGGAGGGAAGEVRARSGGAGGAGVVAPNGTVMLRARGGDVALAYTPNEGPLEHKVLEGVAVDGRKTTVTIPAGQVGNEQPLTITSEEWRSPELGILIMTRHSDPRTGESSYRLTNIVRAEPDASLFVVPADYTVRDTGVRKMLEARRQ